MADDRAGAGGRGVTDGVGDHDPARAVLDRAAVEGGDDDTWRVDSTTLEMDMLGETDRYTLKFASKTSFKMSGPDSFSCQRN